MLYHGRMLLMTLMENKFMQRFTKTNCTKQIKKNLELKKKSREKLINYVLTGKAMIIRLIVGSKKDIVQMREHFPQPKRLIGKVKIDLDFSNYATKQI